MASLEYIFRFYTDTDGWTATPGDALTSMGWWGKHKVRTGFRRQSTVNTNPPMSLIGGALKTTAKKDSPVSESYWEVSGTFAELYGVESGSTMLTIKAEYWYRWHMVGSRKARFSTAEFAGNRTLTGPFKLLDDTLAEIGQFSDAIECPVDRPDLTFGGLGWWVGYPDGSSDHSVADPPPQWGYGEMVNPPLDITGITSDTVTGLRLYNKMPSVHSGAADFVRLKQSRVVVTLEYDPPAGNTSAFFRMF